MTLRARDAMTGNVKRVHSNVSLPDLERRFNYENVDGFAVVDDGLFRGEVTRAEVLRRLDAERAEAEMATGFWEEGTGIDSPLPAADWISAAVGRHMDHLCVRDVTNRHPLTVCSDEPVIEVAQKMTANKAHRVFVLRDRQLVGVISAYDFVRLFANRVISAKPS
jgi:CBS domain-containing protein